MQVLLCDIYLLWPLLNVTVKKMEGQAEEEKL
jgi:hypothetical protein